MKCEWRLRAPWCFQNIYLFLVRIFLPLFGFHVELWEWQGPLRRTCYQSTSYEVAYWVLYFYCHYLCLYQCYNVIITKITMNMTIIIDISLSHYCWNCFLIFPLRMDVYHLIGNDFIKRGRWIVSPSFWMSFKFCFVFEYLLVQF